MISRFSFLTVPVVCALLCCVSLNSFATEPSQADKLADEYFQKQQWTEAKSAYQAIVSKQAKNYRAWYRLGIALIATNKPKDALAAFDNASKDTQIPSSLILYQQAKASKLIGENDSMWNYLQKAVENGYRALNEIEQEPLWDDVRSTETFKALLTGIDKTNRPCIYDEQYNAFDFWLGEWEVYGHADKKGPLVGHSKIKKEQSNCLVMEYWKGAISSTGTSMNFYDGVKNKWVQHWQSNSGTSISLEGGLEQEVMILKGKIYYPNTEQHPVRHFRGSWSLIDADTVKQSFEESIDKGQTWYPWFEGYYFRLNTNSEEIK